VARAGVAFTQLNTLDFGGFNVTIQIGDDTLHRWRVAHRPADRSRHVDYSGKRDDTNCGSVSYRSNTITLTGTPHFSDSFINLALCSVFRAEGITFTGAATGMRYFLRANSAVMTFGAGANYFPGNVAGQLITGGEYDN
jgi:hypothetical protein